MSFEGPRHAETLASIGVCGVVHEHLEHTFDTTWNDESCEDTKDLTADDLEFGGLFEREGEARAVFEFADLPTQDDVGDLGSHRRGREAKMCTRDPI